MQNFSIEIGRIHPAFFKHNNLFGKFSKTINENGDAVLVSPFFTLNYNFNKGILICDDEKVLQDFYNIIIDAYGTRITREEVWDSIDKSTLRKEWYILNAGVCILKENELSGHDGSINCIWYDAEVPGKLVKIVYQFFNNRMLIDSYKLSFEDCVKLGGEVVIPNLMDALVVYKNNKSKHEYIQTLIKQLL